jgi:DNA-binding transcriptional MerR regulator
MCSGQFCRGWTARETIHRNCALQIDGIHASLGQRTLKPLDSGMHSRVDTELMVDGMLRSGELAKATGVSVDTVRHYERIGILPKAERTASGYRVYPTSSANRVLVARRALRIGFTLQELAEIFRTRDAGGAPCRRVFELAKLKLVALETDIAALRRTRRHLARVLAEWDTRMKKAGGQKAHLLQSLTDAVEKADKANFRRKR